eukprot:scaffold18090_cov82-Skeletonema_dohrnii-CCMP3373.AAC.5
MFGCLLWEESAQQQSAEVSGRCNCTSLPILRGHHSCEFMMTDDLARRVEEAIRRHNHNHIGTWLVSGTESMGSYSYL